MSVNSSVVGTCVIDGDTVSTIGAQTYNDLVDLDTLGETGGVGYMDGISTTNLPNPTLRIFVFSGSSALYKLQTSSATPAKGIVQPLDNSTLRWIQVG